MRSSVRVAMPTTIEEASELLHLYGDSAQIYAGGAELVVLDRHGLTAFDYLVDIKRIPGLDAVDVGSDGATRIGATVTHHQLEVDRRIQNYFPMLAEAESRIGNIRIRNQGTIGGNLCFSDPNSDPAVPLLVYEASVSLERQGSAQRVVPLDEFLLGPYETKIAADEVLSTVSVVPLPAGWAERYMRFERLTRPTANVAVAAIIEGDFVQQARLAVGSVGRRARRLSELEDRLSGLSVDAATDLIDSSVRYLRELLAPSSDLLGSAEYKIHLVKVLLRRCLASLAKARHGQ